MKLTAIVFLILSAAPARARPITYVVTANDSSTINFVLHAPQGTSAGRFKNFGAQIVFDRLHFKNSTVDFRIEAGSLVTDNPVRDAALRGPDGLDVRKFPNIEFHSHSAVWRGKNRMDLVGDLTIRGITRPFTIPVTDLGDSPGPAGNEIDTFKTEFVVKCKEFGVTPGKLLDPDGCSLMEDVPVKIVIAASGR